MNRHIYVILLTGLTLMSCAPFSENSVRKEDRFSEESGLQQQMNVQSFEVVDVPSLDASTRQIIRSYGNTIKKYSDRYGFDWRLTLAIMKAESNFLDTAESHKGAYGLMQIMPETQEEVARVLELENVTEPQANIRAGIFYLSRLHRLFANAPEHDRLRLTLAAYNAGPGRVFDAQEVARYLKEDPVRWLSVRDALPLLSKRYYTLHENIWPERRPRSGTFGSYRQTVTYVDKIMNFYDEYRLVLN